MYKRQLSQLHQLRGRVGRSEKQGYCYFLIPTLEIPKLSRNRLDSIIRHSNLGEGFLIAEEDLELRGGGEMLGDKQSGHIDNIGLSLYLSMLKDAINSQKDTKESIKKDIEINFYDSAYISEDYLPSPLERLKIYKKLDELLTFRDLKTLKTDINTTFDIHDVLVNHSGPLISESGIKTKEELLELSNKTSIKTFLIGESLLKDLDNNSIFSVL